MGNNIKYETIKDLRKFAECIQQRLAWLNQNEFDVLTSRMGLLIVPPKTLEEIGSEIGISKQRVAQIEAKALAKIYQYEQEAGEKLSTGTLLTLTQ